MKLNIKGILRAAGIFAVAAALSSGANAYRYEDAHLANPKIGKSGDALTASWSLDASAFRLSKGQTVKVIPLLKSDSGNDSVLLTPMTVAGKNAWYHLLRDNNFTPPPFTERAGRKGASIFVDEHIPWQDWMKHSTLSLRMEGECCGAPAYTIEEMPVAEIDMRAPEIEVPAFMTATFEETPKIRSLAGRAFVNFPVNRTEITPAYMSNPTELRKILNSIDSVRLNPDFTVRGIWLTGYASPEGPYLNNVRLAKGRTEALKEYVRGQYTFPESAFHTNSIAEDWEGLREAVKVSLLPDRREIIDFIDDASIPIEVKNDRLRAQFPKTYTSLLKEIYPSLRHTDYVIEYEIKEYTDIEEIKRIAKTSPSQLSLSELLRAADSYGYGTAEAEEVMETAARLYPDDENANLSVASTALREGALDRAESFLAKAGNSAEAIWARAVLAAKRKDYAAAETLLREARTKGLDLQEQIDAIRIARSGSSGIRFLE